MLILKQEILTVPNVMSSTDQCLRIKINIKPVRKLKFSHLENFLFLLTYAVLKKANKTDVNL